MERKTVFLSTIPFSGFYGSWHDVEIDRTFSDMFLDLEGRGNPAPESLIDRARDAVQWSFVYRSYAKYFAESFLSWLGLDGTFESMTSPKYYNFETDQVFVNLSRGDLARMWKCVDRDRFAGACRDRFTSRSGFISSYSPDWRAWGHLSSWDHNQVGTLVQAFAETEQGGAFDSLAEVDLMESALCNGYPESWIWENAGPDLKRAADAWDYLQDREARPIKTMAQWIAARRAENRPFGTTPLGTWGSA